MKISKIDFPQKIIAFVVTIFATSASLIIYVFPSSLLRIIILGILIVFVLYSILQRGLVLPKRSISVLFLAAIYMVNNYYIQNHVYTSVLTFFSMLLLCIDAEYKIEWARYTLQMSRWIYWFYAVCTIAFYFMPSFYLGKVVPIFPEAANRLRQWYLSGCMAGMTSHYSTNAMLLTVGLVIESVHLLGQKKKNYIPIVVMAVALLLTGKRGHIVFFLMAFYLLIYFYNSDKKKSRIFIMIGVVLVTLVLGSVVLAVFPVLGNFIVRFRETVASGDVTQNRVIFWNLALQWFREHIFFGIGWCQFQNMCLRTTQYAAHVHNVYLQLLCEVGIVGSIIYVGWMVFNLFSAIRLYQGIRKKEYFVSKEDEYLMAFALCFQLFFLLYCITGNPLYDEEMYIPYFMSCSICVFYNRKQRLQYNILKNMKGGNL